MIPGGYGFEVLKFDGESLRDIAKLPKDVRIVAALPPLPRQEWHAPSGWVHDVPLSPVFILVCHRYCVRTSRGMAYQVTGLEEFLSRYEQLEKDEREPLPPNHHGQLADTAWHRDEDDVVREYVWVAKQGWVPLRALL